MRRRELEAISTRHRPPRSDIAEVQTRLDSAREALREITIVGTLVEAQTIADEELSI